MENHIVDLHLSDRATRQKWQQFLESLGIHNFSDAEVDKIDFTLGLLDEQGQLVGTGSAAGNVLKYIGVCNKEAVPGARFNAIVSALTNRLFQEHRFHLFVFTKARYSASFQHLGFKELAHSDVAAFLETGDPNVDDYLAAVPRVDGQATKKVAGIVMNANPFTNGHRYLVEQAAKENDLVYVFVVNTDLSLFKTSERFELVKAGTADLKNVIVVDGGDYMVSYATFPAYFLESADQTIRYQTTLDARVFRDTIAPALNIKTRYVGSEPLSRTTGIYNQVLQQGLPSKVALKIIERKTATNGNYITATEVRKCIKDDNLDAIVGLVPATTQKFVEDHVAILQERIKEGMNINGN